MKTPSYLPILVEVFDTKAVLYEINVAMEIFFEESH